MWLKVVRLARGVLALVLWVPGVLLCGLAAVVHWSTKKSFRSTSELFDP